MNEQVADHLLDLIREAQRAGAVGDTYAIVDGVRKGDVTQAVTLLARDPTYSNAFEYVLGVHDGILLASGKPERGPQVRRAAEAAAAATSRDTGATDDAAPAKEDG